MLTTNELGAVSQVGPTFINNLKEDKRVLLGAIKQGRGNVYPPTAVELVRELWVQARPSARTLDPTEAVDRGLECLPPAQAIEAPEAPKVVTPKVKKVKAEKPAPEAAETPAEVTEEAPKKPRRRRKPAIPDAGVETFGSGTLVTPTPPRKKATPAQGTAKGVLARLEAVEGLGAFITVSTKTLFDGLAALEERLAALEAVLNG